MAVIFPRNLSRQFHQLGQPVQAGSHGIGIVCHALSTVRDGEGFRYAAEAVLRKTPRREVPVTRLRRGYLPGRLAGRPMGPNVDPQDPQAEQRNPPHTSGNGVSATKRGSRAATGIVVLWWQSRHETDSSPGPIIRSARVGGPVIDRYSTDGAITVVAPGLPEAGPGRPQPGRYSAEAIAQQREVAALLRACRDQLSSMRDR
jgi:hypothetical protein